MADNREFNDILDECLESLLVNGRTIEQCLERFPAQAEELRPLLETFIASRQAVNIQPGAEFRDRARNQLQMAFQDMEPEKGRSFLNLDWLRQPQWATAAIALVILIAGGGTVAAAGSSMPDQFLYPVKRAAEQAQLVFTFSELGKAELHAHLADRRVTEIVYLVDSNKPEDIAGTAETLNTHLDQIVLLSSGKSVATVALAPAPSSTPAPRVESAEPEMAVERAEEAVAEMAVDNTAESEEALPAKEADAPEAAPIVEAPLPTRPGGIEAESVEPDDPWYLLMQSLSEKAGINIERLRALLDTVPESARPALLGAIAVSESGYLKALESLR